MSIFKKLFSVLEPILSDGADTTFQVLKEEALNSSSKKLSLGDKELADYMAQIEKQRARRDSTRTMVNRKLNNTAVREPRAPRVPKLPIKPTGTRKPAVKKPSTRVNKNSDLWDPFGILPENGIFHTDLDDDIDDGIELSNIIRGLDI